jgi:membrane-associated phospholipid phosphatase
MLVLGFAVGTGSTLLDDWFLHASRATLGRHPHWMLLLNRLWVLVPVLAVAVFVALRRRQWRLAAVATLCPPISILGARILKLLFGRPWGGWEDTLAYPSGHTTAAITVASMFVLVIGVRVWTITAAVIMSVVPSIGMASNHFHYFTDIIGGALYATSMVCLSILAAGPDALTRARGRPLMTAELES